MGDKENTDLHRGDKQMRYQKWIVIGAVGIGLIFICIIILSLAAIIYLIQIDQFSLPFFRKSDDSSQDIEGSLPPLLSGETFPVREIDYPDDWPSDLRFPKELIVVETSSGILNEGNSIGWITKLRSKGDVSQAKDLLMSVMEGNGWNIQEESDLGSSGALFLIAHPETSRTGVVVIEPDETDATQCLIVVTIHQKEVN
jgi:hypothetical protein